MASQVATREPLELLQNNDVAVTVTLTISAAPVPDWNLVTVEFIGEADGAMLLKSTATSGVAKVASNPTQVEVSFSAGELSAPFTGTYVVDVIHPTEGRVTYRYGSLHCRQTRAGGVLTGWTTDAVSASIAAAVAAHTTAGTGAHAASAISIADTAGAFSSTTVEGALTEVVPKAATQGGTRTAPAATMIWRLDATSDDTLHGPHSFFTHGALFQGTWCRSSYFGYNVGAGGGAHRTTDNAFYLSFEPDYDDGTKRTDEFHIDWVSPSAETLTDGATTSGSPTVTSASATFTSKGGGADAGRWYVGRRISGAGIPANSYIGVVNSATSIGLSSSATSNVPVNATATATGVSLSITGGSLVSDRARPIFMQVNKATGAMQFELNSTSGFTFNTTDGAQTNWGSLRPTGLSISSLTGQDVSLVLTPATGRTASFQLANGGTNAFTIAPVSAGNPGWNFGIGAATVMQLSSNGGLRLSLGSSTAAGVQIPADGSYAIRNAADTADLPLLRNIGNEMYIGGNSTWTGVSFQAGGSTIFRLSPTGVGFYGSGPVAKQTGVAVTAAGIHAALVNLGLIAA